MSYNIDSEECLKLDAWMYSKDICALATMMEDGDIPSAECSFIEELAGDLADDHPGDDRIYLKNLWWYGEGSGRSFEEGFLKHVVPLIHGYAEVVFCYEGGDSFAGYIIDDGEAWEAEVVKRLKQGKKVK